MDSSNASFAQLVRCLTGTPEQRKACRAACTVQTCPLILSYWGYRPNIPINATFAVLFGLFTLLVLGIGIYTRKFRKYTAVLVIGESMEVIGFVARIYAYSYPFSDMAFITQLTCLTLAPAFMAAGIYFSLQRIVLTYGGQNSRIPPKFIPRIFISCDVVSLFLQGCGGALAAYYAQHEKMPDNGNYTMIGGLSFQAMTLLCFLGLAADFAVRTKKAVKLHGLSVLNEEPSALSLRESRRFKYLIISLTISAILIFARSIYRVAELSEGWKGHLMTTEIYVIVFETIPVTIAGLLLAVMHPGFTFRDEAVIIKHDKRATPPSPGDSNREPLYTIRRWNEKAGKCEIEVIYDENHPAVRNFQQR